MSAKPRSEIASRLADVVVKLRVELDVTRQVFGSEVHYVFRDPITSMTHSFGPGDYSIIAELDGERTLAQIFDLLVKRRQLSQSDEDSFYRLLLKIHQSRLINLPIPDHKTLYDNWRKRKTTGLKRKLTGFLFLQIPLLVPDDFLAATLPAVRWLFRRLALYLWIGCLLLSVAIIVTRWSDLQNPIPALFDQGNLFFTWFSLVGLKLIHELGHGYACKHYGGQIPEMGVFLIVGTPSAYVDASSAWGFVRLRDRLVTGLAGMYFESWISMAALVVWALQPETALGGVAYQVFLLAGMVTIAFNANPLMRFDGYFILSDLLGIPNLRARAQAEVGLWFDRLVLGLKRPVANSQGRAILLSYGLAASVFKVTLVLGLCTTIALKFYWLGIAMMGFYLVTTLGGSLIKLFHWLLKAPETASVRRRGVFVSALLLVGIPTAIGLLSFERTISVKGLVQSERQHILRAELPGEVFQILAEPGAEVSAMSPLVRLENGEVLRESRLRQAELAVSRTGYSLSLDGDPIQRSRAQATLAFDQERAARASEDAEALTLYAPEPGIVSSVMAEGMRGRFVPRGEALVTLESGQTQLRLHLSARQFADARLEVGMAIECRPLLRPESVLVGRVLRLSPLGSKEIREEALTQLGGGDIAVRPESQEAELSHFEVLIGFDAGSEATRWFGSTMSVRLTGHREPLYRHLHRAAVDFLASLEAN